MLCKWTPWLIKCPRRLILWTQTKWEQHIAPWPVKIVFSGSHQHILNFTHLPSVLFCFTLDINWAKLKGTNSITRTTSIITKATTIMIMSDKLKTNSDISSTWTYNTKSALEFHNSTTMKTECEDFNHSFNHQKVCSCNHKRATALCSLQQRAKKSNN